MFRLFAVAAALATSLIASSTMAATLSTGVAPWQVNGNPVATLSPIPVPIWVNNYGDGVWVGSTSNDGNLAGQGASSGAYLFTLDLGQYAAGGGTFNLTYAADNSVTWSITNGSVSGATICSLLDCFSPSAGAVRSLSGSFASNSVLTASVFNAEKGPMGLIAVGTYSVSSPVTTGPGAGPPVPEPATWAMMIIGLGAAGSMIRRRKTVVA